MMSGIDLANFTIASSGLVISVLCLLLAIFLHRFNIESCGFFLVFFFLLVVYTASETVCELSGSVLLSRVSLFCSSLFSSMLIPPIFLYMLHCAGKSWRSSRLFYTIMALWTVYFALLVFTQFTTVIYYYTPDNVYHRGPWYPLLLVPPILLMAVNLIGLYQNRMALTRRQRIAFLVYFLVPLIGMVVQIYFYGLLLIVLGTSVSVLVMFLMNLIDQSERYYRQVEKNAQQQANILVLQMRPHFIYNTLMSIYYLCKKDADKAQQVILDFSRYLKKNFTAIAGEDVVPFTEELEHTRAYLAVEKARYEDKLFVEFDTPVTMFRLPPLTLQPIVENAVKYGVSPGLDPLHLSIITQETKDGITVLVEDTGPGYKAPKDNEPHVALANIRQRLSITCNGRLEITPREAGGTRVAIFLPKKAT
jgi:two-component system LytT family sensor kinase